MGDNSLNCLESRREFVRSRLLSASFDLENSYTNFHRAGVNYVCLSRTAELTLKLYELPATDGRYIVSPHNHAYSFHTFLLEGDLSNHFLAEEDFGDRYYKRIFRSKLRGGNGFAEKADPVTLVTKSVRYLKRHLDDYYCPNDEIHSLIVHVPSLVLVEQYADVVDETCAYTKTQEAPSFTGLYEKMSEYDAKRILTRAKTVLE